MYFDTKSFDIEIPREVNTFEDNDGFVEGYGDIIRVIHECPTCGAKLIEAQDRCHKCEQKLKWY